MNTNGKIMFQTLRLFSDRRIRDVTTLQGRGVKARDSHHFRVNNVSMCFIFHFLWSRGFQDEEEVWGCGPQMDDVEDWLLRRFTRFVAVLVIENTLLFPPCCRQVLWERTSMIKLKSYLNLWPEHYQGLQEERFNREKRRCAGLVTDSKNRVLEWMLAMWGKCLILGPG